MGFWHPEELQIEPPDPRRPLWPVLVRAALLLGILLVAMRACT